MEIRAHSQSDAFVKVIGELRDAPVVSPRGLQVREVGERVSIIIERPDWGFANAEGRKFNHAISALEGLSLIGQCSVPEWQTDRVKALSNFQNGGVFRGAYGPRAEGALDDIVALLKRDPDSRQAVVSLFNSQRDLGRWGEGSKSGDVPCTLTIQFLIRGAGRPDGSTSQRFLHMWVAMRSNDAWLGLPYDLGQFSLLQFAVAQALGVRVGSYTHSAGSMHLYENHWDAAARVEESVTYVSPEPRFGGSGTIADTASRARRTLMGRDVPFASSLETYLYELVNG